ncbi:hypothetical protein JRO89_XS03G0072300 [Xanthoceras sorbifolium]|uniref:Uncharacterized protein n=1 Tax=Xanthoceras sorbifolium TaxID=99658 RepID=A0ABQ8I908_9ROSI|nr:hypothetical protein JRO89_XS03G0072300 [Xanthoceras sorbifolium]
MFLNNLCFAQLVQRDAALQKSDELLQFFIQIEHADLASKPSILQGLLLFFLNLSLWGNYDILYIAGILLLAVGEAGLRPLLHEFLVDQLSEHESEINTDDDGVEDRAEERVENRVEDAADDRVKARKRVWWIVAWVCSVVTTFIISNYSWEIIFLSSTSLLAGTFTLFLSGIPFYHSTKFIGAGSSLFNFFPVLKASLLKCHLNYPSSPDLFFQNYGNKTHLSPRLKILRWLDKAAIIESSNNGPEQQERAGRLCTVTQVEESKFLLKMIPMWSTFLVIGLAASTGDTFSSEQGRHLDSTDFTFYMVIFVKPISQATSSFLFKKFLTSKKGASNSQLKLGKIVRIWFGMVLCAIFCAVAWRVEVHRLQIVDRKRNNPNEEISSMSIFWLVPQYCLLGLMEGSGTDGLEEFMIDELPKSLKIYASAMNGFVINGIGNFLGILYVNANRQLFSATLSKSRLDKYYLRLLILSLLNICYYCPISTIYRPIHDTQADMVERDITINHEV